MGNQCCQSINNGHILQVSQKPQKSDYAPGQWPTEDKFIHDYIQINKIAQKPFRHHEKDIYYLGAWQKDVPHGNGIIYKPNSIFYSGLFEFGQPQGKGKIIFVDKNCYYEGDITQGKAEGKGSYQNNVQKYIFAGQWKNSRPVKGTLILQETNTLIELQDYNKKLGTIKYHDNKVYSGQIDIKLMIPQGVGTVTFPNNSTYIGEWLNGKMHGKGVFKWRTNDGADRTIEEYEGDYQYGKKHGLGKFTFASGNIYVGEWVAGKRQGYGILRDQNLNQISKGTWKQDKLIDNNVNEVIDQILRADSKFKSKLYQSNQNQNKSHIKEGQQHQNNVKEEDIYQANHLNEIIKISNRQQQQQFQYHKP